MKRVLILIARGWQLGPSRILPPSCRYAPSCSQYAIEALERHGAIKGGWLATKRLAFGAEYRSKPSNLAFAREDDWVDLFAAYAINKNLSVTAAWVDLGEIATFKDQSGFYISLQAGF